MADTPTYLELLKQYGPLGAFIAGAAFILSKGWAPFFDHRTKDRENQRQFELQKERLRRQAEAARERAAKKAEQQQRKRGSR